MADCQRETVLLPIRWSKVVKSGNMRNIQLNGNCNWDVFKLFQLARQPKKPALELAYKLRIFRIFTCYN